MSFLDFRSIKVIYVFKIILSVNDSNSESIFYIGNNIFEEIVFQEEVTPFKIKDQ